MFTKRLVILTVMFLFSCSAGAETWRLKDQAGWVDIAGEPQGRYLLAVAELKQLVTTGKTEDAEIAWEKLKKDFPAVVGEDMTEFQKAEMLFAQRKFAAAAQEYGRFMDEFPQSPLFDSALQRQYSIGSAYLAGQKRPVLKIFKMHAYEEGAEIMEAVADRTGDSPMAKKSLIDIAESFEARDEFIEAYYRWSDVADRWPTGNIGRESLRAMADNLLASYRGSKFDATVLQSAKSYYQTFQAKYPIQAKELKIEEKLDEIAEQRADKQLDIALYYGRTGSKMAANLYYQNILDNWPNSAAAQTVRARLEPIED